MSAHSGAVSAMHKHATLTAVCLAVARGQERRAQLLIIAVSRYARPLVFFGTVADQRRFG
jgi:hypothetical protein